MPSVLSFLYCGMEWGTKPRCVHKFLPNHTFPSNTVPGFCLWQTVGHVGYDIVASPSLIICATLDADGMGPGVMLNNMVMIVEK